MAKLKKKVAKKTATKSKAVAPKKRGRPKKIVETAPKKRGRPAKVNTNAPAPKKRGRPAKTIDTKTKTSLVEVATSKAKNIAVTSEELNQAKELLNSVRSDVIATIKRTIQSVERSDWDKWVHVQINGGSIKKALTEAIAQELGI